MKALLYGDISLNILDGSSIWLLSAATVLSEVAEQVDLLVKEQLYSTKLAEQLSHLQGVHLVPVSDDRALKCGSAADKMTLTPSEAAERIEDLDGLHQYDMILVRGLNVSAAVASKAAVSSKVWSYITDLPYPPTEANQKARTQVSAIARSVSVMVSQTDEARSYLEAIAPAAAEKTVLMPPIILSPPTPKPRDPAEPQERLRIGYAGKFAQGWMTRELLGLPAALSKRGIDAELWLVGDKFQGSRVQPDWPDLMKAELDEAASGPDSGVVYFGGLSRRRTIELMAQCDFGVSWRSDELDSSLELSTKVLEYLSVGTAPLINPTRANRELLGPDYPGYLPTGSTIDDVAARIDVLRNMERAELVPAGVVERFGVSAAAERIRDQLSRVGKCSSRNQKGRPTRIVFAYHDAKFLGEIRSGFVRDSGFEVADDQWMTLHKNDPAASTEKLEWADVVFCEWAGPNLAWYSQRKKQGQRLLCRFHGFEINGPWMGKVDFDNVDHVSFVSDHHRELAVERFDLPREKTSVITNAIDCADLARPKVDGSQFRIGMLGYVPFLKRPDRAVELIVRLSETDPRYVLHIKGRPPWEYPHVWNDPVQRQLYLDFFASLRARGPSVRNHVVFEPFSPDIGSWLRKIGVVLSPSERETFHLAAAEGMASGSLPAVWERNGATEIFGEGFVHSDIGSVETSVLALQEQEARSRVATRVMSQAEAWSARTVVGRWKSIIDDLSR